MLKIGYDITPLVGMSTGVGNYTRQLLHHMLQLDTAHDFLLLSNNVASIADVPPSWRTQLALQPFPSRMLWMQSVLPHMLRAAAPHRGRGPGAGGPRAS